MRRPVWLGLLARCLLCLHLSLEPLVVELLHHLPREVLRVILMARGIAGIARGEWGVNVAIDAVALRVRRPLTHLLAVHLAVEHVERPCANGLAGRELNTTRHAAAGRRQADVLSADY